MSFSPSPLLKILIRSTSRSLSGFVAISRTYRFNVLHANLYPTDRYIIY